MSVLEVRIDPLDPILFGDSRSTRAGLDHARSSQEPSPATLFGAIGGRIAAVLGAAGEDTWQPARNVLGDFEPDVGNGSPDRAELLGYAYRDGAGEPWLPKPLHWRLELRGGRLLAGPQLRPSPPGAMLSSLGTLQPLTAPAEEPAGPRPEEEPGPLLVSRFLLRDLLLGQAPPASFRQDLRRPDEILLPENRIGITIENAGNHAASGQLFARPYRRFVRPTAAAGLAGCGLLAWYRVRSLNDQPAERFSGIGFLGGERRRAELRFREAEPDGPWGELRDRVAESTTDTEGFFAYLLTPAVIGEGGLRLQGRVPVAAALGRPRHVSGWRGASDERGPRPIRTLAPEGSVLFFEWQEGEDRAALVRALWLAPLDPGFRNAGFGRVLVGVWR